MNHILKCHDIVKTDFVRGENCYLFDERGKRYVDFESGCWCVGLGYNHPRINQMMKTQISKVIHLGTGYPHVLAEGAAVDILEIVGMKNGKCIFLSSGSEAVEFAVQIARRFTGKPLLLAFANSYLGAYGSAGKKEGDDWQLLDCDLCADTEPIEYPTRIPFAHAGGFVFEPGGSGPALVKFPARELVWDIVQRVKRVNGLLIVDEITTGMGRTGKWFGFEHYDLHPDIVALGKGLGNGYPVSAVAMKREIAEQLESTGFHYVQSHQNDPLGCAIAKEVVTVIRAEQWVEKGNALGRFFLEGLKELGQRHSIVKEARGRGMLLALAFYPHERCSATSIYNALLQEGFLVGYHAAGNFLRFDPCLTMEKDDVASLLECLDEVLGAAD